MNFRTRREQEKKDKPKQRVKPMISAGQYFPSIKGGSVFYKKTILYHARIDNIVLYIGDMSIPEINVNVRISDDNVADRSYKVTVRKGKNTFLPFEVTPNSRISLSFDSVEDVIIKDVEVNFLIKRL